MTRVRAFSPHAWGWTDNWRELIDRAYVFPTRVGMDRTQLLCSRVFMFSHTRGDGPTHAPAVGVEGFPHEWGWTPYKRRERNRRVFPHAWGMDVGMQRVGMCAVFPTAWGWTAQVASWGRPRFPPRVGMGPTKEYRTLCACFHHSVGMDGLPFSITTPPRFSKRVGMDVRV